MRSGARLRTDETKARAFAHEVISRVGDYEGDRSAMAEQALEKAQTDAVRKVVLETAVSAPDDVTAAFVRAAVRTGSVSVARAAADLLLDISDAADVLDIIGECLKSSDPAVRRRAIEALETVTDTGAVKLLASAIASPDDAIRRAATSTIGLVVGSKYHPLRSMVLESLSDPGGEFARAITGSGDLQLRREAAQVLGYADSDKVLPVLDALSDDADEVVRREAVVSVAALGSDAVVAILERNVGDTDYVVADTALDALADHVGRDSAEMLGFIKTALNHPAAEVRRHAILMLDHFPPSQAREILARAMRDDDFEVQRSAHEILRHDQAGSTIDWLTGADADMPEGEKTLMVWEAGNIGVESAGEGVAPMLEKAAMEGDESVRAHAVGELLQLRDISQSPALRVALYCDDPSVRSRVAGALGYTSDAALLIEILKGHDDPLVRRRACEALAEDPGGPPGSGRSITFALTRTVGVELASHFLDAMKDPDEGVKLLACQAIGRYVDYKCPMRVPEVSRALRELVDDEALSSLVRDTAAEVDEAVTEAGLAGLLVGTVDGLLEKRGMLAREAHALRMDEKSGKSVVDARAGLDVAELLKRWPLEFSLSGNNALALGQALSGGQPLPDDVAQAVMRGIVRGLAGCLGAVLNASHAVALTGETQWAASLNKWAQTMQGGPKLAWGETDTVAAWQRVLPRLRRQAAIGVKAALQAISEGAPDPSALDEDCADADDWVRMAALCARARLRGEAGPDAEPLATLCKAHAQDTEFTDVLGPATIVLVGEGRQEFTPLLEKALDNANTDLRYDLTQTLMFAAARPEAERALAERLRRGPLDSMGRLCVALALRGAGGSVDGLPLAEPPDEGADPERVAALDALRAMQGDAEAAGRLQTALRGRDYRARYCSAVYLGLARVHSSVPIFAAVSDHDVPMPLRSLCAGMLIRRGHRAGMTWFHKMAHDVRGPNGVRIANELARAMEDVVPLMLHCKDVNVGRFI